MLHGGFACVDLQRGWPSAGASLVGFALLGAFASWFVRDFARIDVLGLLRVASCQTCAMGADPPGPE